MFNNKFIISFFLSRYFYQVFINIFIFKKFNLKFNWFINSTYDAFVLNQYADVTITLARSFTASDIGGNIAVTDPSTSVTGKAKSKNSGSRNSYALTVSESSAADGYFYYGLDNGENPV